MTGIIDKKGKLDDAEETENYSPTAAGRHHLQVPAASVPHRESSPAPDQKTLP